MELVINVQLPPLLFCVAILWRMMMLFRFFIMVIQHTPTHTCTVYVPSSPSLHWEVLIYLCFVCLPISVPLIPDLLPPTLSVCLFFLFSVEPQQDKLCLPHHILEEKGMIKVSVTVQALVDETSTKQALFTWEGRRPAHQHRHTTLSKWTNTSCHYAFSKGL